MGVFSTIKPTDKNESHYSGFPEDMDDWSCSMWRSYYEAMKKDYGQQRAKEILLIDSERIGWFADLHNCKYDCNFVSYFKKEGITTGNIFSKLFCAGVGTVDAVGSVVDTVGNVGNTIKAITAPKILIGGLMIYGLYLITKNEKRK